MHLSSLVTTGALLGLLTYCGTTTAAILYRRPAPLNVEMISQITRMMNETNTVIPGGSPFFYMDDPADNLFAISSISMSPTPCQIGLPCSIEAIGTFREDLPSIELDFEIGVRLKNGQSAKILAVKDDICRWATMEQEGGYNKCPPRRGPAILKTSMSLARGFIVEATYFIDLQLTSGKRKLTHVGAQITLTDPNPNPPGRPVAIS